MSDVKMVYDSDFHAVSLKHDGTGKRKEAKMHRRERRKSETNYDMQRCPLR